MLRFFIALILISTAASADLNSGFNALRSGDFGKALSIFQPLAIDGNAEAQYQVCGLYFTGLSVPKNAYEAKAWCEKAALQGHKEAAYNLGLMFFKGEGTAQNYIQAEYWFKSAATKGHEGAEYNLLKIYGANRAAEEKVSKQNLYAKSAVQARINAEKIAAGQAPSSRAISAPQSQLQSQPALSAPSNITPNLAPIPDTNVSALNLPSPRQPIIQPKQLTLDEQLVLQKESACLQAAQRGLLPENCFNQQPSEPVQKAAQPEQSIEWLTAQAKTGDLQAMNNLGVNYRRGNGVTKSPEKAIQLFKQASNLGSANGMINYASMLRLGEGTKKNLVESYAWYNLAADRSSIPDLQKRARTAVVDISKELSNEEIGKSLELVNKLDETTPFIQ